MTNIDHALIATVLLLVALPFAIYFLILRGPMEEKKRKQKLIDEQREREAERIRWIEEHGTPEEKLQLALERQQEQLRRLGQTVAMGNLFDTFHRH